MITVKKKCTHFCIYTFPYSVLFFSDFILLYKLEEESEDFASQMFSSGFFMIHNTATCGQYNIAKIEKNKHMNSCAVHAKTLPGIYT